MSRHVIWTPGARADIQQTVEYLSAQSPDYADKIVERLIAAGEQLGTVQTGRPGRVPGTYEKSLPDIRFVIAYHIDRSQPDGPVVILNAIHTSRNWPKGAWPE
ncbi:MAG: type II toxin-antitoxin system RelE/ParE family toxin [Devosia sp.]|nr:type II toxin-antitoxin system RelE/ParE family toxin [Devosia sp.]